MSSHCQAGQEAKVTLPNGAIISFSAAPIFITCEDAFDGEVNVTYSWTTRRSNGTLATTVRSATVWGPVGSTRTVPNGIYTNIELESRAGFRSPSEFQFYPLVSNISAYVSHEIISVVPLNNQSPKKRIIIKNSLNNELHNALYDTCDYSVECIAGCPPNTLDCGDCCVDCNNVFNTISSIRALVKGLK